MLIKCPECDLPVSDKAIACPHCGYPINKKEARKYKSNKRQRLPNGFGQISEIKNRNLRKPFRAMVTVGFDEKGKPICKTLKPNAYFATYNEAYAALVEYNKSPYDLQNTITFKEVYDKWYERTEPGHSESWVVGTKLGFKYLHPLYEMKMNEIRIRHMKTCIEETSLEIRGKIHKPTPRIQNQMKIVLNQVFDYAVEYEWTDQNYARMFTLSKDIKKKCAKVGKEHIPYTDEEMETLWSNISYENVDFVLIQCYSGWRPKELCNIKTENVDIENWTLTGGMKTESSINRTVPIHSKIRPFVEAKYKQAIELNSEYLFNCPETKKSKAFVHFTYDRFAASYKRIVRDLGLNKDHRPHDGRKHFISMAKRYGVDEYAIKYLVGHKIFDVTESIYTVRDNDWLFNEIEKIK